jgi:hypothetical protein
LFRRPDHADDAELILRIESDMFTDRIAGRPEPSGEFLVNERDVRGVLDPTL